MPRALYFSQKFIAAIVQWFQNINPDSDGVHIKGPKDLKNEIQINHSSNRALDVLEDLLEQTHRGRANQP